MNTKQLWNALTLNPVTNNNFDGIFSIDTLKEIKEKPTLIVCNTDPSDKAGEYWVLFFFHDNTVDEWFKFTLKPPYSIAIGKLRFAIWDTSFWTFWLKFGHKGP